jgi:glucan phosphoethanolaminetransferase (alkaline phosphatase superfamily)
VDNLIWLVEDGARVGLNWLFVLPALAFVIVWLVVVYLGSVKNNHKDEVILVALVFSHAVTLVVWIVVYVGMWRPVLIVYGVILVWASAIVWSLGKLWNRLSGRS